MGKELKKLYEKPSIKKVKLVPEEAVLQGCKTFTAGGWGSSPQRCKIRAGTECLAQGS
jgi:hypothetical protein